MRDCLERGDTICLGFRLGTQAMRSGMRCSIGIEKSLKKVSVMGEAHCDFRRDGQPYSSWRSLYRSVLQMRLHERTLASDRGVSG